MWAWLFGLMDLYWRNGRRLRMIINVCVNIGLLGYFKYFNFFIDQAVDLLNAVGFQANPITLRIILPVGISFYTFHVLSYTIDVYRRTIAPTRDLVAFLAFVSLFTQLLAGPISRASIMLPQFERARSFDYGQAVDGCRQMLWGFFKKMVVADGCASVVEFIFRMNGEGRGGIAIWGAMFCFAIQIYGDFSGYSDIGIGCSKLFGFQFKPNFSVPYFSRDIAEFWRRWHMSLTTWFRDYVYIPLGGSRCSLPRAALNTFAVFLISGLWHGANWTFVAWGLFHASLFLPLLILNKHRSHVDVVAENRVLPNPIELLKMGSTFLLVLLGWVLFRAPDLHVACIWLRKMLTLSGGFTTAGMSGISNIIEVFPWIMVMICVEWINRARPHGCARMPSNSVVRWGAYSLLFGAIVFFSGESQAFIYFQF
jgi:D-alanyl-lipoteichoic acid acyltransferase DltB (MBOAT superfamily)